jgi:hypothetical protein
MLKNKKNVFWEALIITIVIFLIGLFIGILIETGNSNEINELYIKSEINLVDANAMSHLSEQSNLDCDSLKENNIKFADRIYKEAKLLEQYEISGKLTERMKLLHKKYDLLRTLLWIGNQNSLERCKNYDLIIYLYEYESEEIEKKAKQNVWSKILLEAKKEDKNILLIPIAGDQNITSLNLLIEEYKVEKFPAIIINNDKIIYTLQDKQTIKDLIN